MKVAKDWRKLGPMSFCHPTNSVKAVKEAQISDISWENHPLEKLYGVRSAVSGFYWKLFSAVYHVADLKVKRSR